MQSTLDRPSRRTASLVAALAVSVALAGIFFSRAGAQTGHAADSTPPAPPTFVPTPIGSPPPPPTLTPTVGVTETATAAASSTVTATAAPTATKQPATIDFTLDAARVAKVGNPGNLRGLAAIKPGTRVWLMMYYTVRSLSRSTTRQTGYEVTYGGKTVFKVAYRNPMKATEVGRFSRYQPFDVPATLPYGKYRFHAILVIGGQQATRAWPFAVAKKEAAATTTGNH